MFWCVNVRAIVKAERKWRVVHADDAVSSTSQRAEIDASEAGAGNITDEKFAGDVVCSLIIQGLKEFPFSCEMTHRDNPQNIWELIHKRYSASSTFSKETVN